jgi:hypothetical protein
VLLQCCCSKGLAVKQFYAPAVVQYLRKLSCFVPLCTVWLIAAAVPLPLRRPCQVAYAPPSVQLAAELQSTSLPLPLPTSLSFLAHALLCLDICACSAAAAEASLPSSLRATFSAVSGDNAEQLSDCLLGLGAQSVVVQEARQEGQPEQQKFGAEAGLWDSCQVLAHFPLEVGLTSRSMSLCVLRIWRIWLLAWPQLV